MEQFFTDWWPLIVPLILTIAKLLNVATKHWPQWGPYLRWVGLVVEILDLVRIPEVFKRDAERQTQIHSGSGAVLEGSTGDSTGNTNPPEVRDEP